mmetsp:Transcript_45143/g.98137  ORF Transcript_45143/g.98137 Transcript_45143/m.98137 type:complete len:226 (-) Transcript_45143:1537-2214(-)
MQHRHASTRLECASAVHAHASPARVSRMKQPPCAMLKMQPVKASLCHSPSLTTVFWPASLVASKLGETTRPFGGIREKVATWSTAAWKRGAKLIVAHGRSIMTNFALMVSRYCMFCSYCLSLLLTSPPAVTNRRLQPHETAAPLVQRRAAACAAIRPPPPAWPSPSPPPSPPWRRRRRSPPPPTSRSRYARARALRTQRLASPSRSQAPPRTPLASRRPVGGTAG